MATGIHHANALTPALHTDPHAPFALPGLSPRVPQPPPPQVASLRRQLDDARTSLLAGAAATPGPARAYSSPSPLPSRSAQTSPASTAWPAAAGPEPAAPTAGSAGSLAGGLTGPYALAGGAGVGAGGVPSAATLHELHMELLQWRSLAQDATARYQAKKDSLRQVRT